MGLAFVPEPSRLHARRHLREVRREWPARRIREPAGLCSWRVASREPAQDQPRASRLRDPQGRRFRGGTRRPSTDRTDARPLDGHAVQPLLARRRAGAGRVVGASRTRSPGRARRARLLASQPDWRAPRVSISAVDPQRRSVGLGRGRSRTHGCHTPDAARDRVAPDARRDGVFGEPRLGRRSARRRPRTRLGAFVRPHGRAARVRRRVLGAADRLALAGRRVDAGRERAALAALLGAGRCAGSLGQHRSARGRARASCGAVAVPDRDSVRGIAAAAGNGPHLQQLVREVPSRDALVARGALRALESCRAARALAVVVRADSRRRARDRAPSGLSGRAMAEDDRAGRPRLAVERSACS